MKTEREHGYFVAFGTCYLFSSGKSKNIIFHRVNLRWRNVLKTRKRENYYLFSYRDRKILNFNNTVLDALLCMRTTYLTFCWLNSSNTPGGLKRVNTRHGPQRIVSYIFFFQNEKPSPS